MILLPRNMGSLARITAKDSPHKYGGSLSAVRLEDQGSGQYRACATDGKVLVVVDGQGDNPDQFPSLPALTNAPNGAGDALVPQSSYAEAFDLIPRSIKGKPLLGNVAVVLAPHETTFAATDLDRARSLMTRNQEGRFPLTPACWKTWRRNRSRRR